MRQLRAADFDGRIILGGPQISYAGGGLEQFYPEADFFVRGYGEEALTTLSHSAEQQAIKGVHYAEMPDVVQSCDVKLEGLPSPYLTGCISVRRGQPFLRWETQRGCPFSCAFCQHREAGSKLNRRALPLERLEKEIEIFARSKVRDVAVLDPIFNIPPHGLSVLEALRRQKFRGHLSFQCHFESLGETFLDACRGLDVTLEFGLQTIHEREGRAIRRRNHMDRVTRALDLLHARKIPFEE